MSALQLNQSSQAWDQFGGDTKTEYPKGAQDPDFLQRKVERYYRGRLEGQCGGIHPMKGMSPSYDSVRLRSNDYLCIARHPHLIEAEVDCLRSGGHGGNVPIDVEISRAALLAPSQ
jgi:CAI-1 autoinducer synthase